MGISYIIDAVMGSGKTVAAINLINADRGRRWIYVTPYLTEVERIKDACGFAAPESEPKINSLKHHLYRKDSVVTTHALFQAFDDEIVRLIREGGYSLIMDEVADVVVPVEISPDDCSMLLSRCLTVADDGRISWEGGYRGVFDPVKAAADRGSLFLYNNNSLLQLYRADVFEAFRESYILTYMFESSLMSRYFEYVGVKYERLPFDGMRPEHFGRLIHIIDDFGSYDGKFDLSKSWYLRASAEDIRRLRNNTENFFWNKPTVWDDARGIFLPSKSREAMWTTFKDWRTQLQGKGYSKGFVVNNAKATNEYSERHAVAYLINRFMNPNLKNFFTAKGIHIDDDAYALSEMLQFIWRSAIRNGEPISVYIPSARMRGLLKDWLNGKT